MRSAKSKSIHPNVKRILSFQSEKFPPLNNGMLEDSLNKEVATTAITKNIISALK